VEERTEITLKLTNGKFAIVILVDIHNNWDYLQWAVEEILKHPDWRVVINGDLFDANQYSVFPTTEVTSLRDNVRKAKEILRPIFPQIIAFLYGNHEERCFRRASGKGTTPSYFDVFIDAWLAVNPEGKEIKPMKSLLLKIIKDGKIWRCLIKHGKSAGKNFGIMEFRELLAVNESIDIFVLAHVHIPMHIIVKRTTIEDPRLVHLVRACAGIPFLPYQDKANLFIAPLGLTKLFFNKKLKVELK